MDVSLVIFGRARQLALGGPQLAAVAPYLDWSCSSACLVFSILNLVCSVVLSNDTKVLSIQLRRFVFLCSRLLKCDLAVCAQVQTNFSLNGSFKREDYVCDITALQLGFSSFFHVVDLIKDMILRGCFKEVSYCSTHTLMRLHLFDQLSTVML